MEIVVVGCEHKEIITTEYLIRDKIPYSVSMTPDYEYDPNTLDPRLNSHNINPTGALRCFMGHQLALRNSKEDYTLILEDDAVPLFDDWHQIIEQSIPELKIYDVVLFNLRRAKPLSQYFKADPFRTYVTDIEMQNGVKWGLGSLAYLVGPEGRDQILKHSYDGLPMDLFLTNRMNFCWLYSPDLFQHDRKHGSIVETAT